MAPPSAPDGSEARGPYKFLDYFEEADEDSFAGRDRDINDAMARISKARTFLLYGRSGLGKTSLLKAGVFPRLRARGYRPVYVRTLTDPLNDLYAAVAEQLGGGPNASLDALRDRLRGESTAGATTVALVFDQFEEFFIRFRAEPAKRDALIDAAGALVADLTLDLRVVFSLREDYLAELDDFRRALPNLFENELRLLALTAFGTREAILAPLSCSGIPYSMALVSRLVDELDRLGFDPTLLQVVCSEVYHQAVRRDPAHPELTEDDLNDVGGLDGIFRRYLTNATAAIPDDKLLVSRAVLEPLLTQEKTKKAISFSTFARSDFQADEAEIKGVLEILERSRLLRKEPPGGRGLVRADPRPDGGLRARLARPRPGLLQLPARPRPGDQFEPGEHLAGRRQGVDQPRRGGQRLPRPPMPQAGTGRARPAERALPPVARGRLLGGPARVRGEHAHPDGLPRRPERRPPPRQRGPRGGGGFPDPDGSIALACAAMVADPDPYVRDAAARSVGRLTKSTRARPLDLLRAAMTRRPARGRTPAAAGPVVWLPSLTGLFGLRALRATRLQETEFLASMLAEGHPLEGVSSRRRFEARRLADPRAFRLHAKAIIAEASQGPSPDCSGGCSGRWSSTPGSCG